MSRGPLTIVTLCTGNAARSVMAGFMLSQLAELEGLDLTVVTAGTHVIEGQPMSRRTREALESLGDVDTSQAGRHRSHQLTDNDVVFADVIVAMEADHVRFIRRVHETAADKTVTINRLVSDLSADGSPFEQRLAALDLASADLDAEIDVADPAGGDQDAYDACAVELWDLCQVVVTLLA